MISFQNFSFRYEESKDFTLRGGKFLTSPGAETMLMAGDLLLVMGKKEAISAVQ